MTETAPLHARVLILGSGPAGYTAAIYAARAMLKPVVISGMEQGGQLMTTTDVENYPGFSPAVMGPELMEKMRTQAEHVGATLISDVIVKADLSGHPFRLTGDSGRLYIGESLIIATGAKARWLGLPSEEKFRGYGVSACATCDGFFYRGREVVVVGGGNTAVEEALYLSHIASKVILVHRRDSLRAERILQDRLFAAKNVEIVWNHDVVEVLGEQTPLSVTAVRVRDVASGQTRDIPTHGLFVAIGHEPASELFVGQLDMKPNRYLQVKPGTTDTNIAGVFAAGDVADDVYRQAVTAAGLGCMAALDAERWLATRAAIV